MTDPELVDLARRGDPAAFGELVERHRAAVFRAALAALGSAADAEDAAQEAFLTAYQRLSSFRAEASFKTWLLTIAWHQAINERRRSTRWWRLIVQPRAAGNEEAIEFDSATDDPSPEQTLGTRRMQQAIARAIRALPPKLRDPLLLVQAETYKYDEIASMLGAPVGTIKWRISEARRQVRAWLRERGYSDVG